MVPHIHCDLVTDFLTECAVCVGERSGSPEFDGVVPEGPTASRASGTDVSAKLHVSIKCCNMIHSVGSDLYVCEECCV